MNIELNDKIFELPKWTMKFAKMQDDVEKEKTNELIYKKAYAFVKAMIPKADLDIILDGKSIDDIDLVKLNSVYINIATIYKNALEAPKMDATTDRIDKMQGAVDMVSKVADAANKLGVK